MHGMLCHEQSRFYSIENTESLGIAQIGMWDMLFCGLMGALMVFKGHAITFSSRKLANFRTVPTSSTVVKEIKYPI